jgi:type IV pilus assembly protein PilB
MTNQELDDRLAELLTGYNVVPAAVLDRARTYQHSKGGTLSGALCELQLLQPSALEPLLEELTGVRAVNPSLMTVYDDFVERMNILVPPEAVAGLLIFPAQMELNTLHLCMLNPTDGWTGRAIEAVSGCRVMPLVTHEAAVVPAIQRHYGRFLSKPVEHAVADGRAVIEREYRALLAKPFDDFAKPAMTAINRSRDAIARDPAALETLVREPVIIRLVHQILARAVEMGASDVHVEPVGDALRIRVRIDGSMRIAHTLPATAAAPIIARLKAMADLPLTPSTTPVDARIGYDLVWGRGIDLRFSLVPAVTGEKIVLRVLDRTRERRGLEQLGMDAETRSEIERASDLPNGLILVTGPTGSGKSSTLYALLDRLNDEDTCILTAEDPVESRVAGVTQVQCDEEAGVGFAAALRSFLRQDPDVLMVGEVRDAETADIALKSALTGHLVLSTLHTNDAPGAVLRLVNMNLEPFLIASALRLVVAQRLIRRLCQTCKVALSPQSSELRTLLASVGPDARRILESGSVSAPKGCAECNSSGYRGRVGIFEVLRVSDGIEEMILSRVPASAIRARARSEGMRTLRYAALRKLAEGQTSIAEVMEHTLADEQEPAPKASKVAHA